MKRAASDPEAVPDAQPKSYPEAVPAEVIAAQPEQVQPENPCPKHPELPIAGACARCGAFLCVRCSPKVSTTSKPLCPQCDQRAGEVDRLEKIANAEREIWVSFVLLSLLIGSVMVILPLSLGTGPRGAVIVAAGVLLALPLFVLALMFRGTKKALFAWSGVGVEALVSLGYVGLVGVRFNLMSMLIVVVPVLTAYKILCLAELRAPAPHQGDPADADSPAARDAAVAEPEQRSSGS